ncbi:MAG: N,N-dimethylformamidase beta subunit family domain-containing protein, partial [Actinomycetota bacterium]
MLRPMLPFAAEARYKRPTAMRRASLLTAASITLLCGVPAAAHAAAPPNAIVRENALPGSPDWQRRQGGNIQVYGTEIAGRPGDAIHLHVSTASQYRILVYRLGWYGGAGAREVACVPDCSSTEQGRAQTVPPSPGSALEPALRAGWPVTDTIQTDQNWTTGYYLVEALLTNGPFAGWVATTFFILHEPDSSAGSRILVQVPVNTWEAYNTWGGHSLYDVNGGRVYRVSFERPWGFLSQSPFWWEIQLVRFLEREGYDVSYQTDLDTDRDPGSLLRHRLVMVAGHDEYWTMSMRNAFDAAAAQGTNLAFMGSNAAYWHIEYEDNGQTIFGYKSLYDPNPVLAQKTALWREIGRPECMLMAVQHQFITQTPHQLDYTDVAPATDPWLAGTDLKPGDTIQGVVGREHDVINPYPAACFHPGYEVLF